MKWNKLGAVAASIALMGTSALADEAMIVGHTSDRVHLREGRSVLTASQGLFFTGTRVQCESEPVGEWVAVTIGAQTGYMKAEYLEKCVLDNATATERPAVVQESTFLWQRPEANRATVGAINGGDVVSLLGQTHDGWYYVLVNGVYGYVPADALGEGLGTANSPFAAAANWVFSSGAGAWATTMTVQPDGTFTGSYHDMDMGDTGMGYANGTEYTCTFSGKLCQPVQVDTLRYEMVVEHLEWEQLPDTVEFADGVRYISTLPFGLTLGDTLTLYQSGASVALMTDNEISWVSDSLDNGFVMAPVLLNETQDIGFCQY